MSTPRRRGRSARGGSPTSFRVLAGRTRRCYARRRRVRAQDDERAGGERAWILSWTRYAVRRAERSGAEQSRAGQARPGSNVPSESSPSSLSRVYSRREVCTPLLASARVLSLSLSVSLPSSLSLPLLDAVLARFLWKSRKSGSSTGGFPEREGKSFPTRFSTPD